MIREPVTARTPMQPETDDEERLNILVIKLGALGDFVQALGPMAAVRRAHPFAHIILLTTQGFVEFAKASGYFDEIWTDARPKWYEIGKWAELRRKLLSADFYRVYDLQNNDRTSLYFKLFPKRVRPEWVGIAKGASHRNTSTERTAGQAFEGHVQTLALAGIDDVMIDDMPWISADVARFKLPENYVLLVPGSAPQHLEKRWPIKNYAILAEHLFNEGHIPVVIGTESEAALADEIFDRVPQVINLCGRTSLFDVVELGRRARLTVGNDTGPMHLIAPTGCPSVVLFSSHSNPVRHAPKGPVVETLQSKNLEELDSKTVIEKTKAVMR